MQPRGGVVLNRIPPKMGPENYKSYTIRAPLATHWRRGKCEEFGCNDFLYGFVTTVDISTELGQKQFDFITHDRERSPSMQRVSETLYKFTFQPGTPCFNRSEHRVPVGRPPLLLVMGGDWRGNPRRVPTVRHQRVEDWVEDFSIHQDKIAAAVQRG